MRYGNRALAGILLYLGPIQWFLIIVLSEGLSPSYNGSIHYISELGVGPTAILFNASLIIFGIAIMISSYFLYREYASKLLSALLVISGVGAAGVGVFPTNIQPVHGIFQAIALLIGAIAACYSFRFQRPPLSYTSILLGLLSLVSSILFFPFLGLAKESTVTFLGLTKGSMERIVIYPLVVWMIGFGGYLIGAPRGTAKSTTTH